MKNKNTLFIVLTIAIGTFMSSLDSSVVNLVTPMIKESFGITLSTVEWIVTAYLLVISSLLLTFGRISDLYGHKKVYLTGYIIFTTGSLLCGLSGNITMLISFRVVQAIGAGMLFSTGPAIITNAVPPSSRGKAFSISAMAVAFGLCTGPVVGGSLATLLGWQSIFFINIPIGILGFVMAITQIPKDGERNTVPFDKLGSLLMFVSLMFMLLPLSICGDYKIPIPVFVTLITAGVVMVAVFAVYESRCQFPMLNLSLFKNHVFTAGNVAALFVFMAQFIMAFLAPFYLQNLRMFSAFMTGMLYMPMPLATILIAPISGVLADRFNSRYICSAGAVVMTGGLLMMSFLNEDTSTAYIIVSMILTGIGSGLFQTPNNSAVMGSASQEHRGVASGTLATMRNIGMVMGVAVSGALFSSSQNNAMAIFASQGMTDSLQKGNAFIYALHITFTAAVIVSFMAVIASFVKGRSMGEKRIESKIKIEKVV